MDGLSFVIADTEETLEAVERLAYEIWNEHFPSIIGQAQVDYMLEKFSSLAAMQNFQKEGYMFYIMKSESHHLGYFSYKLEKKMLILSKLYVHADHRGKGIARETMKFMGAIAKKEGKLTVRLTVNRDNLGSIQAYEKMGFEKISEVVMDIGGGFVMDDFVMSVAIDKLISFTK
ncbi:GNAT family N-acetyltransferase [Reichenbachiella agarivorans]|uniref:GNAT family N-acetyltransferase n=1 Tax=Reichenbachiella agarivorans TaxID=2979464 RepID=A0ABY6CKS3_9BACT|nr:GNAT family N-acetyltransferase [Reichenbachiella agarivorans]UXP31115.1 GNAT family N-acetyltransferase [Reichenbachiella agarivorans]